MSTCDCDERSFARWVILDIWVCVSWLNQVLGLGYYGFKDLWEKIYGRWTKDNISVVEYHIAVKLMAIALPWFHGSLILLRWVSLHKRNKESD